MCIRKWVCIHLLEAAASGAALLAPAAALAEDPDNTINPTDAIVQAEMTGPRNEFRNV